MFKKNPIKKVLFYIVVIKINVKINMNMEHGNLIHE
jgi:hypothetical protein